MLPINSADIHPGVEVVERWQCGGNATFARDALIVVAVMVLSFFDVIFVVTLVSASTVAGSGNVWGAFFAIMTPTGFYALIAVTASVSLGSLAIIIAINRRCTKKVAR